VIGLRYDGSALSPLCCLGVAVSHACPAVAYDCEVSVRGKLASKPALTSFWDRTTWRDEYYARLMAAPMSELSAAQAAERTYCHVEEVAVGSLIEEASHIADLGCGTGRVTHAAVERFPLKSFIAIDLSQVQLDVYRDRLSVPARARVRFVRSPVSTMPINQGEIDLALFCNHTFGAIQGDDRLLTLDRVSHALSVYGRLVIVGFSNLDFVGDCYHNWGMSLVSVDPPTGRVQLTSHTSLWEAPETVAAQLRDRGFALQTELRFLLGYLQVFSLMGEAR
jgi:ubiquinone/menaquinone biosynthesis C-methylase UbiE